MFVEKIVFVKLFEYVRRSFVFSAMVFGGHTLAGQKLCFLSRPTANPFPLESF